MMRDWRAMSVSSIRSDAVESRIRICKRLCQLESPEFSVGKLTIGHKICDLSRD
jgi:hypothetical protein